MMIVIAISLLLALGLAGTAVAQMNFCSTLTFENGSAQPGGSDTVCGTTDGDWDVTVSFDSTQIASSTADQYGYFCVPFTIPADATPGTHTLTVEVIEYEDICDMEYVVESAEVAPAAETPAPVVATLPSTGFMLLPAAGLLGGGFSLIALRRRRR